MTHGVTGNRPTVVHVLESSAGREVHRIDGLSIRGVADFDGDGIADLWGVAASQLRAFRGPMPEAWRALGYFQAAGRQLEPPFDGENHIADLDGDGIGDAITGTFTSPSSSKAPGTRSVVARSGRDGHALWQTSVDPPRVWGEKGRWARYETKTFPLPSGDLDGDGAIDVLVKSQSIDVYAVNQTAFIPLELLSGRTGRRLWSAGRSPIGLAGSGNWQIHGLSVCTIEPGGSPAIVAVMIRWPWMPGMAAGPSDPMEPRLVRFAGRTGQVVWDKPLLVQPTSGFGQAVPDPSLADFDGDGSLDAAVLIPLSNAQENRGFELRAVALGNGETMWSRKIPTSRGGAYPTSLVVDLDGDNRLEIVILWKQLTAANKVEHVLEALDAQDGQTLWNWRDGAEEPWNDRWGGWLCDANFDGTRNRHVCLGLTSASSGHRIVIFDAKGRQTAHRDLSKGQIFAQRAVDVNADGRDELVVALEQRLAVLGKDLQEVWGRPEDPHRAGFLYLPAAGKTPTLAIQPPMGLDAATGRPRWVGEAKPSPYTVFSLSVLDPGNTKRLPLLFSAGSTAACYQALPATAAGKYAPPEGTPVPPGLARNDPRWTRPLPWLSLLDGQTAMWTALSCTGLAFVNVLIPLLILRLATRRRPWTIRVLMALPIAAVVPLMAYVVLEPVIAARADSLSISARMQFVVGTLAGIPVIFLAGVAGWSVLGRSVKTAAALAALTLVASAVMAAGWLWFDSRSMPAIEQYGSAGWYLIVLAGAYATGLVALCAWLMRGALRLPRRSRRPSVAEANQVLAS